MEKENGHTTPTAPNTLVPPVLRSEPVKSCPEEPLIYVEADVPPYEEEFTLSGGCCSGS